MIDLLMKKHGSVNAPLSIYRAAANIMLELKRDSDERNNYLNKE